MDGIKPGMDRLTFLRQFSELSVKDYELFTESFTHRQFKKGEVLLTPGQTQRELYFVNSGVQMSCFETESKTHVIAFTYAPGLCAVPDSFSLQKPSTCSLVCLTDTEVDSVSYNVLQLLFDESQSIERLFRKMTEVVLAGMINRHIELHSLTMEERYRAFCKRSPHLLQLVPHKYLASYLGIDPTNFSKLYNSVKI